MLNSRPPIRQICIALALLLAAACLPAHAQDAEKEKAARQWMAVLRSAEEYHRAKSHAPHSYGSLDDLRKMNACPFGEAGTDPVSGYQFRSAHTAETYTIVAIPPRDGLRGFKVAETGVITDDLTRAQALAALPRAQGADRATAALRFLRTLRSAEDVFRAKDPDRSYIGIQALKDQGHTTIGEGEIEPVSGYSFYSTVRDLKNNNAWTRYTILAVPPEDGLDAYKLIETGEVLTVTRATARHWVWIREAEGRGLDRLRAIRSGQEVFRQQVGKGRYGTLAELRAAGITTLVEGEVDPKSGYRFRMKVKGDAYTITATAPSKELTSYKMIETGDIFP